MAQVYKHPESPKLAVTSGSPLDNLLDAELFKALADPTRNRLLRCLAACGRACSVSEVAECCSVDFSVVSRHLAVLAQAGLLESEKVGRTVFYHVRYRELSSLFTNLAAAFACCGPSTDRKSRSGVKNE